MGLRVLALCDGVATGLAALKRLGIKVSTYHAIDISAYKRKIADENHPEIERPFGHDIYEVILEQLGLYDLVICGFTCKSLSSQGNREGLSGESKIFYKCVEIVDECRRLNPGLKVFFENVASMSHDCRDEISSRLFLKHQEISSGHFGPQERNRYYWFNWEFSVPKNYVPVGLKSTLDNDAIDAFSVTKSNRNKIGEPAIVKGRIKELGNIGTLTAGKYCWGQSTRNYVITKDLKVRPPSKTELANWQGMEEYKWPCTDTQFYESIGEGWELRTITEIFRQGLVA